MMPDVRFKDLPQEAREILARDLTHENAMFLAIDAVNARESERQATFPADPMEGLREARKVGSAPVKVEFDDPVELALDLLEVAIAALHRKDFDGYDAPRLARVLETAEAALRVYNDKQKEVDDRVRAILFPLK